MILGSDELVMFDHAELGPLDVQLWKQDEIGERSSGLAPTQAFLSLDAQVASAFQDLTMRLKFQMLMTTRTAGDIASRIVSSLYGGIYAQMDPLRLGEIQRAQAVGLQYGQRLIAQSGITNEVALYRLVSGYPSHGFVIDVLEAKELFPEKVREPTTSERALEALYHGRARTPVNSGSKPIILFLNEERADVGPQQAPDADAPSGTTSDAGETAAPAGGAPTEQPDGGGTEEPPRAGG